MHVYAGVYAVFLVDSVYKLKYNKDVKGGVSKMKALFKLKFENMTDRQLLKLWNEQDSQARADWKSWGDNVDRLMAEELNRRGLID